MQSQNILVLLANRTICFALLLTAQSLDQLVVLQVQQPSSVQGIPGLTELITTSQLENLLRDNEYLKINHKSKARTATKQSTRDTWASRVSSFCLKIRSVPTELRRSSRLENEAPSESPRSVPSYTRRSCQKMKPQAKARSAGSVATAASASAGSASTASSAPASAGSASDSTGSGLRRSSLPQTAPSLGRANRSNRVYRAAQTTVRVRWDGDP